MEFEVLKGSKNTSCDYLLEEIVTTCLEYSLPPFKQRILNRLLQDNNIPWQPYSSHRLSLAIESGNHQRMIDELVSRYYYDCCFGGQPFVEEYPPLIQVEISSQCNFRCVFCFQTDETFSSNPQYMGFMSYELFKSIIDQCEGNIPYITFSSRGEPTLNKEMEKMISYCKGKFLDVKINTNGSLLTEKRCEVLLDVCDTVVFSVDAPNKEEYETLRVNGKFEKLIENIRMFNAIREKHPRGKKVSTRVSGVHYQDQDFEEFNSFFRKLSDQTSFIKYHPWEDIYTLDEDSVSKEFCPQPFYRMFVWWDGSINVCDVDYKSKLCEGTPKISSTFTLKDAWSSMSSIRNMHLDGKRNAYPCNVCPVP